MAIQLANTESACRVSLENKADKGRVSERKMDRVNRVMKCSSNSDGQSNPIAHIFTDPL